MTGEGFEESPGGKGLNQAVAAARLGGGGGECWLSEWPVDTTGAGDAFSAALAVKLAEGRTLEEAEPFANAAAALATQVLGASASLPTREAVEKLLREAL